MVETPIALEGAHSRPNGVCEPRPFPRTGGQNQRGRCRPRCCHFAMIWNPSRIGPLCTLQRLQRLQRPSPARPGLGLLPSCCGSAPAIGFSRGCSPPRCRLWCWTSPPSRHRIRSVISAGHFVAERCYTVTRPEPSPAPRCLARPRKIQYKRDRPNARPSLSLAGTSRSRRSRSDGLAAGRPAGTRGRAGSRAASQHAAPHPCHSESNRV